MANRSYLFATDLVPAKSDDRPERIVGLSEWPYDIPLAYMLLVSEGTRICPSLSFSYDPDDADDEDDEQPGQPPLALAGEAAGGYARLLRFLDLLAGTAAGKAHEQFLADREETKKVLAAHGLPYYFLETAEIDTMTSSDLAATMRENLVNVQRYARLVDSLTPQNIEQHLAPGGQLEGVLSELGKFEERQLPTLGIGYWTDVLWLAPPTKAEYAERSSPTAAMEPEPGAAVAAAPPQPVVSEPAAPLSWLDRLKRAVGITGSVASTPAAPPLTLTLSDNDQASLRELIRKRVWGGFATKSDIEEEAFDHLGNRTWTADESAFLYRLIEEAWQAKKAAEATWPEKTDFDRLDHVFFKLDTSGEFIAYPNAGYTQSEGWEDCNEEWHERGGEKSGIQGAIFYHGQDVERVIEGGKLLITFGPMSGSKLTAMQIAQRAVDAFRAAGFTVVMPPDENRCIEITGLDWKNRSPDE